MKTRALPELGGKTSLLFCFMNSANVEFKVQSKGFFHQRLAHHPVARLACARESQPVLGLEKWMVRWSAGSPTHYRQPSREGSPGDRGGERQRGRPPRAAASAEACPRPSQAAGDLQVLEVPPGSCVVVLPNPARHDGPPPLFHPFQCCLFLPSELSYSLHLISQPSHFVSMGARDPESSSSPETALFNSKTAVFQVRTTFGKYR